MCYFLYILSTYSFMCVCSGGLAPRPTTAAAAARDPREFAPAAAARSPRKPAPATAAPAAIVADAQ